MPLAVCLIVYSALHLIHFIHQHENIVIGSDGYMAMKRITVSVPYGLYEVIEYERESRKFKTVSETVRAILTEFFRDKVD